MTQRDSTTGAAPGFGGSRFSLADYQLVKRPPAGADYTSRSKYRWAGIGIAFMGLMVVMVASVANFVVGDDAVGERQDTLAWTFGLNFMGINLVKVGIAATLMGVIIRAWMRVESVKTALPRLKASAEAEEAHAAEIKTRFGRAEVTRTAPRPLWIHRLAEALWTPMVVMGPMLVAGGLVTSIVQANETAGSEDFTDLGAWTAGLQFLGEAAMLAGISFLLGTILSSLRKGGGEVQESLGLSVQTLKVPLAVWLFLGLMMMGMMAAMAVFVGYLVATGFSDPTATLAWLQPAGFFSLGLLLAGIALALYSIATVLGFQFDRIREIITTGR